MMKKVRVVEMMVISLLVSCLNRKLSFKFKNKESECTKIAQGLSEAQMKSKNNLVLINLSVVLWKNKK